MSDIKSPRLRLGLSRSAWMAMAASLPFVTYREWSAWQWMEDGSAMGHGWLLSHREGEPLAPCVIDLMIAVLAVGSLGWLVESRARNENPFALRLTGLLSLAAAVGATISAIAFIASLEDYRGTSILSGTSAPPAGLKDLRIPVDIVWLSLNVCLVYAAAAFCWRSIAKLRDGILKALGRGPV